jgi:hypothetical protein
VARHESLKVHQYLLHLLIMVNLLKQPDRSTVCGRDAMSPPASAIHQRGA